MSVHSELLSIFKILYVKSTKTITRLQYFSRTCLDRYGISDDVGSDIPYRQHQNTLVTTYTPSSNWLCSKTPYTEMDTYVKRPIYGSSTTVSATYTRGRSLKTFYQYCLQWECSTNNQKVNEVLLTGHKTYSLEHGHVSNWSFDLQDPVTKVGIVVEDSSKNSNIPGTGVESGGLSANDSPPVFSVQDRSLRTVPPTTQPHTHTHVFSFSVFLSSSPLLSLSYQDHYTTTDTPSDRLLLFLTPVLPSLIDFFDHPRLLTCGLTTTFTPVTLPTPFILPPSSTSLGLEKSPPRQGPSLINPLFGFTESI